MREVRFHILKLAVIEALFVTITFIAKIVDDIPLKYMIILYFINLLYLQCCNYYVASKSDKLMKKYYRSLYEKYKFNFSFSGYPEFVAVKLMFSDEKKTIC